jgi:hypothetical protein
MNPKHRSSDDILVNKRKCKPKLCSRFYATRRSRQRSGSIRRKLGLYTQEDGDETHAAPGKFLAALGMKSEQSSEFVG